MPTCATGRSIARLGLILLTALHLAGAAQASAQAPPSVDELLSRVGERIAEFYKRAQRVICIETSRVQPINHSYSPEGFARIVESELRLEPDGSNVAGEARVMREIRKVNGRQPRERDKSNRDGCTDPTPLSGEPLAFLLPAHRSEYQFKAAGLAKERSRRAFRIDFSTVNRNSKLELIEDKQGHEDCFDWSGDLAARGRIWVDAESYDVLRVERSVGGPVDVRVPLRLQRRHSLDTRVVIMREDTTIRYRTVSFTDPEETLLLPESIESLSVLSGGLQSTRRSQTYTDYKRFVGDSRVVE